MVAHGRVCSLDVRILAQYRNLSRYSFVLFTDHGSQWPLTFTVPSAVTHHRLSDRPLGTSQQPPRFRLRLHCGTDLVPRHNLPFKPPSFSRALSPALSHSLARPIFCSTSHPQLAPQRTAPQATTTTTPPSGPLWLLSFGLGRRPSPRRPPRRRYPKGMASSS